MSDLSLLLEILSWSRPHKSETEKRFAREFLDTVPGMQQDNFGNRWLDIGDKPTALWSCHIDTVASKGELQLLDFDTQKGIVALAKGKPGMSLGADDGAGVWIMLEMIRAKRPGRYVFHRGEELGCLGSIHIAKYGRSLLGGIDLAVAFDRKGTGDIITWQSSGKTASDEFAWSMAAQLGKVKGLAFQPDDTGVFTDTDTYAGDIAECSNLSVGYEGNHGPRETLDINHVRRLLDAMLQLDTSQLVIAREAGDSGLERYGMAPMTRGSAKAGEMEDMLDAVRRYPQAAAEVLLQLDMTAWDVMDASGWGDAADDRMWEDRFDG